MTIPFDIISSLMNAKNCMQGVDVTNLKEKYGIKKIDWNYSKRQFGKMWSWRRGQVFSSAQPTSSQAQQIFTIISESA